VDLIKIHPLGKSLVIKDGEKVVAESGFIIEYLIEKYGKGKN
jgi:glutathione S-transferase